jgi:hypothetical protein
MIRQFLNNFLWTYHSCVIFSSFSPLFLSSTFKESYLTCRPIQIQNVMVTSIPRLYAVLNYLVNPLFICSCRSEIFNKGKSKVVAVLK